LGLILRKVADWLPLWVIDNHKNFVIFVLKKFRKKSSQEKTKWIFTGKNQTCFLVKRLLQIATV